jgi:hypothetical protein
MSSLILGLFCGVLLAAGQTEDELGARFKKVAAFEIRSGIVVFPTFAANGSVCQMIVEKRKYINSHDLNTDIVIPSTLANQLVDELVPPDERGRPSKYLSPQSYILGRASFIKQDYENVSVSMYGTSVGGHESGTMAIIITWPKRVCPNP